MPGRFTLPPGAGRSFVGRFVVGRLVATEILDDAAVTTSPHDRPADRTAADPPGGRGRASRPGGIALPPGAGRFVTTEILDDVEVALLADYHPTRFDA